MILLVFGLGFLLIGFILFMNDFKLGIVDIQERLLNTIYTVISFVVGVLLINAWVSFG